MIKIKILLFFILALSLVACSSINPLQVSLQNRLDVRDLAINLDKSLTKLVLKNHETVIFPLVNLKNFKETDSVGHYIQQQLYHYLFHLGFRLVDLRVTKEISFIPEQGEFNLSRIKSKLKKTELQDIKSVITGTYIEIGGETYFNISMIELDGNTIRASCKSKMKTLNKKTVVPMSENEILERPIRVEH